MRDARVPRAYAACRPPGRAGQQRSWPSVGPPVW